MRAFYDGYLFAPSGNRLYNPYSVLKALKSKVIRAYWFITGTPSFLVRLVKMNDIGPESLDGVVRDEDDLDEGNPRGFMERQAVLLKNLPSEDHRESTYRATTFLLCLLCGTEARAELHSYRGRSDLEVVTHDYIYGFEFKNNKSVEAAMHQLHDRDYAGRYALNPRPVYLIGANFSDKKTERGLSYEIEVMPRSSHHS